MAKIDKPSRSFEEGSISEKPDDIEDGTEIEVPIGHDYTAVIKREGSTYYGYVKDFDGCRIGSCNAKGISKWDVFDQLCEALEFNRRGDDRW